jgi:hypothetical protein
MIAPIEVDLKLELPPAAVPQLRKLPLIRSIAAHPGEEAALRR